MSLWGGHLMKRLPSLFVLPLAFAAVAAAEKPVEIKAHNALGDALAFSPDGKQLVSAGADGVAKVWDVAGQKELKALKAQPPAGLPPAALTGAVFTPDGKSVVTIGQDRFLRVWDVGTGMETKKLGP